jgi:hypothetical protein
MFSYLEVHALTDKKCKRCHGKGWANWGPLIYGPCHRCGGETGLESKIDVPATMKSIEKILARIKAEGEKAKADLEVAVNILHKGSARRSLERARREYKQVLVERQRIIEHYKVRL